MNRKQAKAIIKEFKKAHLAHSQSVGGYWGKGKLPKHFGLKNGHWYWKGHHIFALNQFIKFGKKKSKT